MSQRLNMDHPQFDLVGFLRRHFPKLGWPDLGDAPVFYSAPIGLRFALGAGREELVRAVARGVALYEAMFGSDDRCVVAAVTWPRGEPSARFEPLFEGAVARALRLQSDPSRDEKRIDGEDAQVKRLEWVVQPARSFDYAGLIGRVTAADFTPVPAPILASKVYFIAPDKCVLFHPYDERGLDIVATQIAPLAPLYRRFNDWILDHDRSRINEIFADGLA